MSIDVEVKAEEEAEFPYKYIEVDGERYRIPSSVLNQLKVFIEDNKELKDFKVKKTGEGMGTDYTVIPLLSGVEEEKV